MNFFEHQDQARRKTGLLIFYYVLAMLAIFVAFYALFAFLAIQLTGTTDPASLGAQLVDNNYINLPILGGTALFVFVVIGGGSMIKIASLSSNGGASVAQSLGGREVSSNTSDPLERRLLNVVEEMAIASGVPVPSVYVLDNEPMINAFAAGNTTSNAAIGVTRGCIEYLNRDELQGVIAHEFSHILNGDMRLNIKLIGILFGLNMIVLFGWMILRSSYYTPRRSNDKDNGMAFILLLALGLVVIGFVGRIFSMLIQAAICRQREFLADASAVQFTRNPDGIAGALKKIGSPRLGSAVANPDSIEASHLFIGPISGLSGMSNWNPLATHPPLEARIRMIEPNFDGVFPKVVPKISLDASDKTNKDADGKYGFGSGGTAGAVERIGKLDLKQLVVAAALLESIPDTAKVAVHDPLGAKATIYALLLDSNPDVAAKQWEALEAAEDSGCISEIKRMQKNLTSLAQESRMPLVQQAFPALRNMSELQYKRFRDAVQKMILADGRIDLFEYALHAMLVRDLDIQFGIGNPLAVQYYNFSAITAPFTTVLSYLAYNGTDDLEESRKAFDIGMKAAASDGTMRPRESCTLKSFDEALKMLNLASMPIKRRLLNAFVGCIAADNVVTPREGELMRAICAVLGCPMPPMLG